MKRLRLLLITVALLILTGTLVFSVSMLFFNYGNVRLLRQAEKNIRQGKSHIAEAQLKELIRTDHDNERAFILLWEIARREKKYPDMAYYGNQAHELNPLSTENRERYMESLLYTRDFPALERILSGSPEHRDIMLYSAGQNGNPEIYKDLFLQAKKSPSPLLRLLLILTPEEGFNAKKILPKLAELQKETSPTDTFLRQEIAAARAECFYRLGELDNMESALLEAYRINDFAFAPMLGAYYADNRNMGEALKIFEKYLSSYHDPVTAMQTAEIYCLLGETDKISQLRRKYQSDPGESAMICSYYLDTLTEFSAGNIAGTQKFIPHIRHRIRTPLSAFIYLCAGAESKNYADVLTFYQELLNHRKYLDLQTRARRIVLDLLKNSSGEENGTLLALAEKVNAEMPDIFAVKYLLLAGYRRGAVDNVLLTEALKKYPSDRGIRKIAIEYFLSHDLTHADKMIAGYEKDFPGNARDMLRRKIFSAVRRRKYPEASVLFQQNFSPELLPDYWEYALANRRIDDLNFLRRSELYRPFCEAAILLINGQKAEALELLQHADARGNQELLFFAARTLGEADKTEAALQKYAQFPDNSPYRNAVLLNSSELYAEKGDLTQALNLASQAYRNDPGVPEIQLCYVDKLRRIGRLSDIPPVVQITAATPLSSELRKLWILGMEEKIRQTPPGDKVKLGELCRQLLLIDPENAVGLEKKP